MKSLELSFEGFLAHLFPEHTFPRSPDIGFDSLNGSGHRLEPAQLLENAGQTEWTQHKTALRRGQNQTIVAKNH